MSEFAIVVTTCDKHEEATQLARGLVEARLAACVQVQRIESHYQWSGAMENADEFRLAIKTRKSLFPQIEEYLRKYHSYEVPEILMTAVAAASKEYSKWIEENTLAVD